MSSDEYFYSLIHTKTPKKVACVRCKHVFLSLSFGNRTCAVCIEINNKKGKMAFDHFSNNGS